MCALKDKLVPSFEGKHEDSEGIKEEKNCTQLRCNFFSHFCCRAGKNAKLAKRLAVVLQTTPSYGFGRYGFAFFGPRIAFRATDALWGRATPFFYHFSVHLSSVLGRTELCHEVWTPGPQKPQIISNENHHLALLECCLCFLKHLSKFPQFSSEAGATYEAKSLYPLMLLVLTTSACFGGVLRGNTIRGNRPERFWEGNLPLRGSLRGPLRGMVSELFRGFQRFLEVFRGF